MSLVDPCSTNVKMYQRILYQLVRGTPPHVSWKEPKGRGDTRWRSYITPAIHGLSMDGGVILAGKVIREYIVTPAVHGYPGMEVILAGKVICDTL